MNFQPLIFDNSKSPFVKTLKKRVDDYFKSNQISKYANLSMYIKSISLILFYFGSYATLYFYNESYYSINSLVYDGHWNGWNWHVSDA